jgi:16S rRNA (guanine966-N2)-methyltransferase
MADRGMADRAGRVIAGRAAGRRLLGSGPATRPLTDRVKEALFAILEPNLPGSRFLDLCAGTGAGAIEALSRGAASATLVERDPEAIRTIGANLERTGLDGPAVRVVQADAGALLSADDPELGGPFDIVLLDPPYDDPALLTSLLGSLARPAREGLLTAQPIIVAKHFWKAAPPASIGLLRSSRERRFGETTLTFYGRVAREDG